jgi:hypothetical protein
LGKDELKERGTYAFIIFMKTDSNYKPKFCDTLNLSAKQSLIYPSLAFSLRHQPCLLKSLSLIPLLAAAVAPPDLKECKPYLEMSET